MDIVVVNRRTLKIGERIRFANRDAFERSENCFVNRSIHQAPDDRSLGELKAHQVRIRREDLTENMASMAGRWHGAREQFHDALVANEGDATFEGVQHFLSACRLLARERRLSRYAYLAMR